MFLLTMKERVMDMLMLFIFVNQILHIFGKITVLRGSLLPTESTQVKVICLSEDDGGALVWNYNLIWKYPNTNNYEFRHLNEFDNNGINCKMKAYEGCLESWNKQYWNLTNSLKTPMGPVFDQRWEEFKQYENLQDVYDYVDIDLTTEVKLSFSVRTLHDAYIFICNGKNYNKDPCYWIIIGGWNNTSSVIRKCITGVPMSGQWPSSSECTNPQASFKHTPLSESEWRSFVITWNSKRQKITVYDTDKIIMTYTDKEWRNSYNKYYMFIRSISPMLFRFHIYDFLHTTVEDAVLTSPVFQVNSETICIQLIIGLCAECDAHVVLRNPVTNKKLAIVIAKGSLKTAVHGLSMWQSVEIKRNFFKTNYNTNNGIIIQLIPKINKDRVPSQHSTNPLWAIANVRQCPQNGTLRKSVIISNQDKEQNSGIFWPTLTCQKLFYNEHSIVNPLSHYKSDINLDDADCPEGKIGPQCLFSCKRDLSSTSNCEKTKICYKNGCTCAPGFLGDECFRPCQSNKYGHGCKNTCGSCFYTNKEHCNKVTGACVNGLCNNDDNATKIYIPPLCQTSVEKPNTPTIISTSETTIRVKTTMTWKNEYEGISILYSFVIQGHIKYGQQSWKKLFRNMTQLTEYFENMEPGAIYYIGLSLNISDVQIHSDWQVTETKCNRAEHFDVKPEENGIIIDWQTNIKESYSCPASWYNLVIRNVSTNNVVIATSPLSFPYKLQHLSPYTSFNVTISHKNHTLFSQGVSLEGVPSTVLDLQSTLSVNTRLTLTWKPPYQPNGKIVRYEITLKVEEYYGCKDLKLPSPDNHIITKFTTDLTITIPDLHPYTYYSAQVIAHNSRHFSSTVQTFFNTTQSEIPSEVFSKLKVQDWKLSWMPPEDCTTILGPIKARINIRGISDAVKYFKTNEITSSNFLDLSTLNPKLNGAELYVATVYVIRDYSTKEYVSAYQKYKFETPPTAPPRVNNLEIVEIDTRQTPAMIHLRWKSPHSPLNGKLHNYNVELCDTYNESCSIIKVPFNESCNLWDDYICKVVKKSSVPFQTIKVSACNTNVTEPGLPVSVTDDMLNNTTPDPPGNCTFMINNNSVVDLNWLHPWKTGGHLKSFRIRIKENSSNFRKSLSRSRRNEILEFPVTQYMRNYSERLYLFPSTQYNISIQAVTVANISSRINSVKINTPSTAVFDGTLKIEKLNSTLLMYIPSILNDTQDSMMHIIVKGPSTCEQYSKVPENLRALAGVKKNETAWQAAKVSTIELAGRRFRIGDNGIYGNSTNCPLKLEEFYEIVIIVIEQHSTTEPIILAKSFRVDDVSNLTIHYIAWPISIILLLLVTGTVFYLYQRLKSAACDFGRKRQKWTQIQNALSPNICEHEMEPIMSNSKKDMSILNKQSFLRATTSEVPPIAITNAIVKQDKITSLVKVKDFEKYVRQAIQSGLLDKQYEMFAEKPTWSWNYKKMSQNKFKNQHDNFITYDKTRVILKKHPDDIYSDYINANYITDYKKKKRYIVAQEPEPDTIIDFWRMIWQENVSIICTLTNAIKCEQYWPDISKKMEYGDIIVLTAKHKVFANYTFRTFHVTYREETRKIEHLHYTTWPDRGIPLHTHSVVTYMKKLLAISPGDDSVVIHCKDDTGRLGTIILCDICLHRVAAEGSIDIFAEMLSIVNQGGNIIDNKQQYFFAHLVLVECLFSIPTTLSCNKMLITQIKELKKQSLAQYQRLQNTAWQDEVLRQVTSPSPLSKRNQAKNIFPELILDKVSRIYLKRYPASDEDSDYLSGVYVDGVKFQNQYLATQLPMPSTINDFWRMIAEFKVELILMLQHPDFQDPTCCLIAPISGVFKPNLYLNITVKETVETQYYTSQKLLLIDNSEKPLRKQYVTILCLTEWKSGKDQPPPSVMTMMTFWQAAENITRSDKLIVTLCHDGVTGCGLYLALSFLLERMTIEEECDVYLAVRAVRRSRPDFVCSLEHLEYLYDAVATYLEFFETYENIL
ncbi:receptor-type tyrosine-protein phosphatase F [Monomorium pharaonis]|uniref:receptor-type tyrosine-protein phosphatase F n=1 Tax=Monomorium pharaonis TaxID=307658 RepID=UPI001746DB83|nr:receptor-type tyrosine-protein phosphatase F [Monomorium pharaonis]